MLTNFRKLFSPYGNVLSSSSARSGPCASSRGSTKRRFQPYKVKETWIHKFFYLSNQQQERVPSKAEKLQLQEYGLGFGSKDGAAKVKRKLESTYPKLVEGGGFEILRSGARNDLVVVTPPMAGYSVPFLRDQSGLGQALAYVRPLQSDLVVEVDLGTATVSSLVRYISINDMSCLCRVF